jgi:alkyl hydroperoxide reductase subunit AhpC
MTSEIIITGLVASKSFNNIKGISDQHELVDCITKLTFHINYSFTFFKHFECLEFEKKNAELYKLNCNIMLINYPSCVVIWKVYI